MGETTTDQPAAPPTLLRRFLGACWQPETALFLGFWLILLNRGRSFFFKDQGTFWHTVTGQLILQRGNLPTTDPFSFTFQGQPWMLHEWLAQIIMALVYRIDGFSTHLVVAAGFLAGLFAWLDGRMIRAGVGRSLAILVVGVTLLACSIHFLVRPHLFTMLFLTITCAALCAYEHGRIPLHRLFWLVPMFVFWVNVHGGFLGGFGTVGLAVAGWTAYRIVGWPGPLADWRSFFWLGLLVVLCGAASLVNPYGYELPEMLLKYTVTPGLEHLGSENARLDATDPVSWAGLALGGAYVLMLLTARPLPPRVMWCMPVVWLVLSFSQVRHLPLCAILSAVVLPDLLPHTAAARWLTQRGCLTPPPVAESRWQLAAPWLVPLAAVLVALGLQAGGVRAPLVGHDWAQLDADDWPVDLLPELRAHQYDRPEGTPIWNDCVYGGFLIHHTPGFRVFGDDRCDVFGVPFLLEYNAVDEAGCADRFARWEERFGRFDFALTQVGTTQDSYFRQNPAWRLLKESRTSRLYQRR